MKEDPYKLQPERPMFGFVHGPPSTGKSRLIYWIIRLFKALGWVHGEDFLCVAFQNRAARAMQGTTLHNGGGCSVSKSNQSLEHANVDALYTKNQDIRRVLIDEGGMIADKFLGEFQNN